jgi:hypothetical protein
LSVDFIQVARSVLPRPPDAAALVRLRRSELIGRRLGSAGFVAEIEKRVGRAPAPGKRRRKPRSQAAATDQ